MSTRNPYLTVVYALLCLVFQNLLLSSSYGQEGTKQWLQQLNVSIREAKHYDHLKMKRIDSLRQLTSVVDGQKSYDHLLALHSEFALFNFDSAYHYANKAAMQARQTGQDHLYRYAQLKENAVLLSAGMFTEVSDSMKKFDPNKLDRRQLTEYYIFCSRFYSDLSNYTGSPAFSPAYEEIARKYDDSILLLAPVGSFEQLYYSGLRSIRAGEIMNAARFFKRLIDKPGLTSREQAITYSTYSDVFIRRKMTDSAIIYLAKAAIADIHSSTKETTAILNLATILFEQGDLENASTFIQKAAVDARLFGARQRLVQLSNILPVIEAKRVASVESQKYTIRRYAIIITLVIVPLLILGIIITRQVQILKKQRKEINLQNRELFHLVEEKEWLLKEIHHRVKNNLHTINSLLESQSAYLRDDALLAIRDSQRRIFAMSLIHQKLYQPGGSSAGINMPAYILELIAYLRESFETGSRIHFETDLQPLVLDISIAVSTGLILNEAIINALKYAFPTDRNGTITVSISQSGTNHFHLSVRDNGIGLPTGFDINKASTLGIKLMKGLSAEIDAAFSIKSDKGTLITLSMKTTGNYHST